MANFESNDWEIFEENKTLSDKRLGYGKILKKMDAGEYNLLGKEFNDIAEGFVYPEEDIKEKIQNAKKRLKNESFFMTNHAQYNVFLEKLNTIFFDEFGEKLC